MLIGYGRASTTDREDDLAAQEKDLQAAGCEKVFIERVSRAARRRQLESVLASINEGDIVVVARLDRLARSLADLLTIIARLESKKVALRVLTMPDRQSLGTANTVGRLLLAAIGAVGQFEQEMRLERQQEATARTQRKWNCKGRPPTVQCRAADIRRLNDEGMKPSEIAMKLGIGRTSVYRVLAEETGNDQVAA